VLNKSAVAPSTDEIEVSLFGPGYGETVLVHVGDGDWLLVDSCQDSSGRQPALEYLRSLGIEPSDAIRSIIITHWHDDHVRLVGSVVRQCPNAQVVLSTALRTSEFLTLVRVYSRAEDDIFPLSSGIRELAEVLDVRMRDQGGQPRGLTWAIQGREVWSRSINNGSPSVSLSTLSPSDSSVTQAIRNLGALQPVAASPPRRLPDPSPNHTAVVLWIRVGDASILLGADLEETADPSTGWTAILDSQSRPQGRAEVFKIPHHGSENAHQPRVWSEMLVPEPVAILTPWWRGRGLPTDRDRRRICSDTPNAYLTTTHPRPSPVRRPRPVEKAIHDTVRDIRPAIPHFGRLTARRLIDGVPNWSVTTVEPAGHLCTESGSGS
jgi:beta-lactamase superfamily II metal-dependent hydrolase